MLWMKANLPAGYVDVKGRSKVVSAPPKTMHIQKMSPRAISRPSAASPPVHPARDAQLEPLLLPSMASSEVYHDRRLKRGVTSPFTLPNLPQNRNNSFPVHVTPPDPKIVLPGFIPPTEPRRNPGLMVYRHPNPVRAQPHRYPSLQSIINKQCPKPPGSPTPEGPESTSLSGAKPTPRSEAELGMPRTDTADKSANRTLADDIVVNVDRINDTLFAALIYLIGEVAEEDGHIDVPASPDTVNRCPSPADRGCPASSRLPKAAGGSVKLTSVLKFATAASGAVSQPEPSLASSPIPSPAVDRRTSSHKWSLLNRYRMAKAWLQNPMVRKFKKSFPWNTEAL